MARWMPFAAALALLLGTGLAYGVRSNRWAPSTELRDMVGRLPRVPLQIGDWVGQDEANPTLTDRLKAEGTVHELVTRVYKDLRTGDVVTVLLATGKPGPISTHNPHTCLGDGAAWDPSPDGEKAIPVAEAPAAVFSRCDFVRTDGIPVGTTIYWAWRSHDKGWVSVRDARVAFGGYNALTKIYVTQDASPFASRRPEDEPARRFLRDCLPAIDATLFGPDADAPAAPAAAGSAPAPAAA